MKTAIIGGDKRMLYAARAFLDSGAEVAIAGFDDLQSLCDIRITSIEEAVGWADFTVLPVLPIKNGLLNCPYSAEKMPIEAFARLSAEKPVFCGFSETIGAHFSAGVFDYAAREEFAVRNAVLTAEGAVELLLRLYEDSLCGANVLVMGYGRIGRTLARLLKAFGAGVTVAARKPSALEWARAEGCRSIDISNLELKSYQLVLNTIPAPLLDRNAVYQLRPDAIVIDLASAPGGVDFESAKERGLTCIHALGLPGKISPKAAGTIIRDTIIQIIKEENGGKDDFGLCGDRLLLHL